MKIKFLLVIVGMLSGFSSHAQKINGVPISEINQEYIQIIGTTKFLSSKWRIKFDFGQETKLFSVKEAVLTDENNRVIYFNSMIDALNFMSKNGYEYLDSCVFFGSEQQNTIYYILKKKKKV
jgi:hypothetical protein